MDVALQFRGFIHPLWGAPPPAPAPTETVSMWARIQRLHFEARMASGPNSSQLVRESACHQHQTLFLCNSVNYLNQIADLRLEGIDRIIHKSSSLFVSLLFSLFCKHRSRNWWVVGQPSRRRSWSCWLVQMGVDCSPTWPGVTITSFRLRATLTIRAQDRPVRWPWSGTEHCLEEVWVLARLNLCFSTNAERFGFACTSASVSFFCTVSIGINKISYLTSSFCRRSPSCSWSLIAQVPAQDTCPVWHVCQTSPVAGVRLCPAACCGTAQTWSPALRQRRGKAKERVSAICCWRPSTAPCVKSTETAQPVLRYVTKKRF